MALRLSSLRPDRQHPASGQCRVILSALLNHVGLRTRNYRTLIAETISELQFIIPEDVNFFAFLAQIICIIDFVSAYCWEQNMQICRNMSMAYSCRGFVRSSHLCYRRETLSTIPTAFLLSYLFDVLRAPRSAGLGDLAVSNHPSQGRFNGRRADVRVKV